MSNKWYAVQYNPADAWDNGSDDLETAKAMLKRQGAGLIAVIVDDFCEEEITFDDLFDMDDFSDEELADIVGEASAWDIPGVMEAMTILCDRAGQKLCDMMAAGVDCSEHFAALRGSAPAEFLTDTPDISNEQWDMIDWLRHGAEQADMEHLAYAVQDILGVSLI